MHATHIFVFLAVILVLIIFWIRAIKSSKKRQRLAFGLSLVLLCVLATNYLVFLYFYLDRRAERILSYFLIREFSKIESISELESTQSLICEFLETTGTNSDDYGAEMQKLLHAVESLNSD